MNSTPRKSPGDADDPWEDLAEQLFGTTPGTEHTAGHDTPTRPVPDRAETDRPTAARENPLGATAGESSASAPRNALEALLFDDSDAAGDRPATAGSESAPGGSPAPSFEAADSSARTPQPKPATSSSPQDSYWDLLANWNWDDGDGSK